MIVRGRYSFGDFVLDVAERSLMRRSVVHESQDERVSVQPRTFDLLVYLVTHAGNLRTKQALLDEVWRDVVVTENSLSRSIHQLRIALADTAEEPRFVETVPRVGYRFIASVTPGETARSVGTRPALAESAPSVAVLPFVVMSSEAALSHLGEGFAEEITSQLARRPNLKVASRTSAFQARDGKDATAIGRSLGVAYLVEGSIRPDGNGLRLTAQLARTRDGFHVWSSTYDLLYPIDRKQQEETLRTVSWMLDAGVSQDVPLQLARSETDYDEAYNAYAKAQRLRNQGDTGGKGRTAYQDAVDYVDRALALDPDFASALDLRANLHMNRIDGLESWEIAVREARKSIDRALTNNPNRAASLDQLAAVQIHLELDYSGAEATLDRIRVVEPGFRTLNDRRLSLALRRGQTREAMQFAQGQVEVDPYNAASHTGVGVVALYQGDLDLAEREFVAAIQVAPQSPDRIRMELLRIRVWTSRGEYEKAKTALEALWTQHKYAERQQFGFELARLGHETEARTLVAEMEPDPKADPYWVFYAYYGLRDYVRALDWLRRGIDERNVRLLHRVRMPNALPEIQELPEFRSELAHLDSMQRSR